MVVRHCVIICKLFHDFTFNIVQVHIHAKLQYVKEQRKGNSKCNAFSQVLIFHFHLIEPDYKVLLITSKQGVMIPK